MIEICDKAGNQLIPNVLFVDHKPTVGEDEVEFGNKSYRIVRLALVVRNYRKHNPEYTLIYKAYTEPVTWSVEQSRTAKEKTAEKPAEKTPAAK